MKNIKDLIYKLKQINSLSIIDNGENNTIKIPPSVYTRKVKIKIFGNNNTVEISDNSYLHNVHIRIGFPDPTGRK